MWFLFGFITLISFSSYVAYKRINAAWKGTRQTTDGLTYQYKVERNKHGISALLVGIDGPKGYDYALKKENGIDRFFKSIGLSVEHQTGKQAFDDLVYIVSDNRQFHRQISSSEVLTDTLLKIFNFGKSYHCHVQELRHNSGRLWIKFNVDKAFEEKRISSLSSKVVPLLESIGREFKSIPLMATGTWRDPFVVKAALLLAASSGLAVNGVLHGLRLAFTKVPFTVDAGALLHDAIIVGAFIAATLLALCIYFLGRSARTHLVMIDLMIVGTLGAMTTAYTELRDINMELDTSEGTKYEITLYDKHLSRSRRSTTYYVHVNDWNRPGRRIQVEVSGDLYYSLTPGEHLAVTQKKGYLKYRWVEKFVKALPLSSTRAQ